jgi:hypothetical protein
MQRAHAFKGFEDQERVFPAGFRLFPADSWLLLVLNRSIPRVI